MVAAERGGSGLEAARSGDQQVVEAFAPAGLTPRPPKRPFGRYAWTGLDDSYTSMRMSHDMTEFSAPTWKKEIALRVFDLELPAPKTTSMATGRLASWSNDILLRLCGPGFADVTQRL
jgi:hypothetical protein